MVSTGFSAHDDTSEASDLRVWNKQTGGYLDSVYAPEESIV
jgi:hypothetical protein